MPSLADALGYAQLGWPVFPAGRDKAPLIPHGVHEATIDPAKITEWWTRWPDANIAHPPGAAGHMVLDIDPGADLEELARNVGPIPDTRLKQRTPRGGEHWFLTLTKGERVPPSAGKLAPHVDVRSDASYVLLTPSVTDAGTYSWEHEAGDPYAPMPVAPLRTHQIVEAAGKPRSLTQGSKQLPPFVKEDDQPNIEKYINWLKCDARVSIEYDSGNNVLAATGAMGASHALSWDKTLECMEQYWNDRCLPPWDGADLEYYGGSGYRSASSNFGNMAEKDPWLMFGSTAGNGSVFKTMADIASPAPAREWAAGDDKDGWIPLGGVTLILGPEGTGKSLLSQQWALAQARGEKLFNHISLRRMPVLLINCEDDEHEMHRRFENLGKRSSDAVTFASMIAQRTVMHPPFHLTGDQPNTPFYRLLDEQLGRMGEGPKLLFLDNATHIFEGDPNKPADVKRFQVEYLGRLARTHNTTIILFMHPSESARQSGAGTYGSVTWSAGVRSRLYFEFRMSPATGRGATRIEPKRIGEQRVLSRKKSNYAKSGDDTAIFVTLRDGKIFEPVATDKAKLFEPVVSSDERPTLKVIGDAMLRVLKESGARMSDRGLAKAVVTELKGVYQPTVLRTKYFDLVLGTDHEVCQYRDESGNGDRWQYR